LGSWNEEDGIEDWANNEVAYFDESKQQQPLSLKYIIRKQRGISLTEN
jgi:hypothetical protein